jgi:hypothetical protein
MAALNLLPNMTQLALENLIMDETTHQLTTTAVTTATEAACPLCQRLSHRVHPHLHTTLSRPPSLWAGSTLAHRCPSLRCQTEGSPRTIFTERFPPCTPAYPRRRGTP